MSRARKTVGAPKRVASIALGTLLVALAAGCPPVPPPPPLGPTLAPDEALRRVVARRGEVHGFRARAAIEVTIDQDSYSSDAALVAIRPASLRFETLSLIGPTLVLAIDGTRLTAYSSIDRQFFHGTVGGEQPAYTPSLVLPPLPASSLVDALLATPLATAQGLTIRASDDGAAYVVEVPASASVGPRRLTLDPRTAAPLTLDELEPDGTVRYHAAWERADQPVPAATLLEVPGHAFKLRVRVPRADLDPSVPPTLFEVKAPAGATIVDLDAAATNPTP